MDNPSNGGRDPEIAEDSSGEIEDKVSLANQKGVPGNESELTSREKQIVAQLKASDREVRAHEQAHKAAAGPYAIGGPQFQFVTGPDGKRYAVGGEVQIDTAPVSGNPEATIRKAQTVRRAANAPSNPSGQDRQVAAQASRMEANARQEKVQEQAEAAKEAREQTSPSDATNTALDSEPSTPGNAAESDSSPEGRRRGNGSDTRTAGRIQQFSPAPPAAGGLLDIIS